MNIVSGVVSIEYSHFYITEHIETGWQLLGKWPYQPVSGGRMSISGPTTSPAVPAACWLTGGRGHAPDLQLDPASTYTVHVYAKGRQDSRARYEAAMDREEWGLHEGFEDYVVAFVPTGQQVRPRRPGHSPR
ncbi:hypothetical protein [Streptomyces melanogenes]|uniref:Uncharacterized protein n=1 Tax=Streptomyces melanogenes TaxID=67326 RepID=A0ABZ1XUD9_9ACTN|nr:hypothetical protein [Streptomyces melanogenes]